MTTHKRALLSVFNKTGIMAFATSLVDLGYTLVSSGGTANELRKAGIEVTDVADITGFPAMLDDRVKTLHPLIHGAILGDTTNPDHVIEMEKYGIQPFSLVVVNLYDFAGNPSIGMIDVGGPTMVRGAAKNHASVGIATSPNQYAAIIDELEQNGELSDETRQQLAIEAFAHTAAYDLAIVEWMSNGEYKGFLGRKTSQLKYGENAWQAPAFIYTPVGEGGDVLSNSQFEKLEGAEPSFVGATDQDRALEVLIHAAAGFDANFGAGLRDMAIAVKHGNACGFGIGATPVEAIRKMVNSDPESIFGAVVMTTFDITREVAEELMRVKPGDQKRLFDAVIGSSFDEDAADVLRRVQGKCRMLFNRYLAVIGEDDIDTTELWRQLRGGSFAVQPNYTHILELSKSEVYGGDPESDQEEDLVLGWAIGSMANSNSIALVKDGQLLALGTGQQSRIGALKLAIQKAEHAGHDLHGASLYSDSFFPYDDVAQLAGEIGITAIFSSAGAAKQQLSIDKCEEFGIKLLLQPDAEVRGFGHH